MQRKVKIILILVILIGISFIIFNEDYQLEHAPYKTLANTSIGTVEKVVYGNENSDKCIALITGIHPRETLSIVPEIISAQQYVKNHGDVKIIHYKVTVTKDPTDYKKGRANGEKLVHDYVNPDVTSSDADCVIISHSHIAGYGQGFYVATPNMDNASTTIAYKIKETSDFNYYPKTGNEAYKSSSAVLVSNPIAQAGYPTFVYEIPENITEDDSTRKTMELFDLMVKYAC